MVTAVQGAAVPQTQHQQSTFAPTAYPQMILATIEALDDKNGSSKAAISKHMESCHPDLPPAHATLLSHHLNNMKQTGQLLLVKNNYLIPDPNAPPKRGRGRPPKPKDQLAAPTTPTAATSPRPRGRPPKAKDLSDPTPQSKKVKASGGTGRPRGRPPKKSKTETAE